MSSMLVPLLALLTGARAAAQDQVVLVDTTYTATTANTDDSHYRVSQISGTPTNWVSPVSYASGKIHARLEVLEKPSAAATLYNICFEGTPTYACMPYSPKYTAIGVYDFEYPFSAFYQNSMMDWTHGTNQIAFILKDENELKKQGDPSFYPTKVHISLTLLAPGVTYLPPTAAVDAGSEALDAAATQTDAAQTLLDAGGGGTEPDAGASLPSDAGVIGSAGSPAPTQPSAGGAGASGGAGSDAPLLPAAGTSAPMVHRLQLHGHTCSVAQVGAAKPDAGACLVLALAALRLTSKPWRRRRQRTKP